MWLIQQVHTKEAHKVTNTQVIFADSSDNMHITTVNKLSHTFSLFEIKG